MSSCQWEASFDLIPSRGYVSPQPLYSNRLVAAAWLAFKDLSNLRYLNLGNVQPQRNSQHLTLVRLEELEMSGNQLSVIKPSSFETVNLQKLWMMHAQSKLSREFL
ncbi:leucine-rich repeat-containing protein 4C [Lates japonicus]|uniref:Leucine-rich repeat-containing protein 4C n=1 Tax=Lates japonicus TaxID=270547 RepID=A0AAD3ML82_LATJO|nr:leucine-rich repeat-containing protein 4C [Lates japonicus]